MLLIGQKLTQVWRIKSVLRIYIFPLNLLSCVQKALKNIVTDKISLRADETQTFYWSFKYMSNYHLKTKCLRCYTMYNALIVIQTWRSYANLLKENIKWHIFSDFPYCCNADRCNSLSCPPPPRYLVPGDTLPRAKTWFILSSGTLQPGVKCPPLKFISYLFFFYNFYSATYFIALKMNFLCEIYYEWTN